MNRWKLTIEYDGTGFCGWQRQTKALSVQQVLEESIQKFSGEKVDLHVAGRTDAGVHARAQVAHFDLEKQTEFGVIRDALNFYVRPHRIVVLAVSPVATSFHARFDAKDRSYEYLILNRRAPPALQLNQVWHVHKTLDIDIMQKAAALLIGKHDFTTFRAQHCQSNSPIRTLDQLDLLREGEVVTLRTRARSFLYHQVRNMVGTLVMVGAGQWSIGDFEAAFNAKDRTRGGPTAPSQGLYFRAVTYPEEN